MAANPHLDMFITTPHELPSPFLEPVPGRAGIGAYLQDSHEIRSFKNAIRDASSLADADDGLHTEHEVRRRFAVTASRRGLAAAGVPTELHDAIITQHAVTNPEMWERHTPVHVDPQQVAAQVHHRQAVRHHVQQGLAPPPQPQLAVPTPAASSPVSGNLVTAPSPASAGTPPVSHNPMQGPVRPPASPGGAGAPVQAPGPRSRAPRTPPAPVPPGHFDTYKGRYAVGAAAVGLGAVALHAYQQRKHEAEVAALHEAAKTASGHTLPKEVADPFGQLNVHMAEGGDTGSIVGSVVPIVGPIVGGLVGKGVGAMRGVAAHHEAAQRYEKETGKALAFPTRHPFGTAALASAGLFPVGAAPMGPAVAMGLAHATRPKDADPPADKQDVLSRPYAHLAAKQMPGQVIGAGVGGTLGTLAGRHYGEHHVAEHAKALEEVRPLLQTVQRTTNSAHAAELAGHLEQAAARTAKHLAEHRLQAKYGLGIGGAIAGAVAGGMVGKIPGILSAMHSHKQVAEAYEKETGKRLPGIVKSPYIPYIASGVVTAPLGLSGVKNKAFGLGIQYKMDPGTKDPHSIGDDVHGFADYLHKRWFR